ncbi:MAG: tetratricopeptide repeat protein [Colwellia sp.]
MTINLKTINSDDFFDLIMDAFESEDRQQTKWLLKKAKKRFPKHHLVPYVEALLAVTINDTFKGLKLFTQSLKLKPEFSLAHANLSHCYKNLEKIPKMLHHAALAVKYANDDETDLVYQQQEMLDLVSQQIPEHLTLEKYIEDGLTFDLAYEKMLSDETEQAIILFEQVLANDPHLSPVLGNLGICYMQLNNLNQSRIYLEKALNVDPNYVPAQRTLTLLEKIELGEEAIPEHILSTYHGQIERNI